MMNALPFLLLVSLSLGFVSCTDNAGPSEERSEQKSDSLTGNKAGLSIKEEAVTYTSGAATLKGYVAFDSSNNTKRPIVLVVPEWWGLTEYPRLRAKQLAQLGYFAVAVDIYGEGRVAGNPDEALKTATPFYQNPTEASARLEAALAKAMTYPQADSAKTAAIGYCFGGSMVLNAAKLGAAFDGVVSFHGGLEGVPARKDLLKAKILVCHGAADNFVPQPQVDAFRKSMDSIGADYDFMVYEGATHAFTNPDADIKAAAFNMPIKYNGAADTASWNDMRAFLTQTFR